MARLSAEEQEIQLISLVTVLPKSGAARRSRLLYLFLVAGVMVAGLLWRSRFLHLPPFLTKYGGDAWWALLVFFGFGFLFSRISTLRLSIISICFAWAIEFSQLYHAPWIDSIRGMRLGLLILGSTFNWPDLPAYVCGIALGAWFEIVSMRMKPARGGFIP